MLLIIHRTLTLPKSTDAKLVYNPGSGSQESTDCSSRTGFIVLSQGS